MNFTKNLNKKENIMKTDIFKELKRFGFVIILSFALVVTLTQSFVFAANKPGVIVFYTNWNALSREAVPLIDDQTASYGKKIDYHKINIDDPASPEKARGYGVSIPRSTPYIIVIDKNGKVIFQGLYNEQTNDQLKTILNELT